MLNCHVAFRHALLAASAYPRNDKLKKKCISLYPVTFGQSHIYGLAAITQPQVRAFQKERRRERKETQLKILKISRACRCLSHSFLTIFLPGLGYFSCQERRVYFSDRPNLLASRLTAALTTSLSYRISIMPSQFLTSSPTTL